MDPWLSGRASRLHREGQRFESSRVHQVRLGPPSPVRRDASFTSKISGFRIPHRPQLRWVGRRSFRFESWCAHKTSLRHPSISSSKFVLPLDRWEYVSTALAKIYKFIYNQFKINCLPKLPMWSRRRSEEAVIGVRFTASAPKKSCGCSSVVERLLAKEKVTGSNPAIRSPSLTRLKWIKLQ